MDFYIFVFLTFIGFICLLFGYLLRGNGIASAFNIISMMIFVLVALVLLTDTVTTMVYTDVANTIDMDLGLSRDHLGIIYLCLSFMSMYAEL